MKVVVFTQYRENYGDEESPYWKAKGGSELVIKHISVQELFSIGIENLVEKFINPFVKKHINYANPMSEEYMVNWDLFDDNQLTESEKLQLEYEGKIVYPAKDLSHLTI